MPAKFARRGYLPPAAVCPGTGARALSGIEHGGSPIADVTTHWRMQSLAPEAADLRANRL